MGDGREPGGGLVPQDLDLVSFSIKYVFLVSSGKSQISLFLEPPGKIPWWPLLEKSFRRPWS